MTIAILAAVSFLNYFEARNTIANYILESPSAGEGAVECSRPDMNVVEKCPACAGAGELRLEEPNYGQADGRIGGPKKTKVKCQLCGGKGKRETFVDPSSLALQVVRDREAFALAHQQKGEIPVGLAFVPQDKYSGADKKMLKLVENTYGKACKCNWTGLVACRKCGGSGTVKCTNADCKGGWEVETRRETIGGGRSGIRSSGTGMRTVGRSRNRTRTETKTSVNICPVCGGADMLVCPECAGRKAVVCKGCSGLGYKQSK